MPINILTLDAGKNDGLPHTFEYRREELAKTVAAPIRDIDVLNSFLKETAPTGLTGQYLQLAHIATIVPNAGILAMHGGVKSV